MCYFNMQHIRSCQCVTSTCNISEVVNVLLQHATYQNLSNNPCISFQNYSAKAFLLFTITINDGTIYSTLDAPIMNLNSLQSQVFIA